MPRKILYRKRPVQGTEIHYSEASAFATQPATDSVKTEPVTHVPLPTAQDILQAKEWVDDTQK